MKPGISIIMAAHNAEPYIGRAIDSVLKQTFHDWELLITDDGSTDDTGKIIRSHQDSRIRLFEQENKGVGAARNVGLRHMSGKLFCFLDADDRLPPDSLEIRYNKMAEDPEIDFLDGSVHLYDQDLEQRKSIWKPDYRGNPLGPLLNISDSCFFGLTWMIRRQGDRNYRFSEHLSHGEDLLFYIDVSRQGGKYDFVDGVVLHCRRGHSSAMRNLRGLETGYHQIYRSLRSMDDISVGAQENFRRKARSIIFKSYLGNIQVRHALWSLTRKW